MGKRVLKRTANVSVTVDRYLQRRNQGPDLQNILRQSYDYLTIMPKLRSIYDGRIILLDILQ